MIDLDRFKSVNDRFGHDAGDRVLREVAARVADLVRPGDVVGRLGGEEFIVLCVDADAEQGLALAERIRSAVAATVTVGTPPQPVTVSIGVAARPPTGDHVVDDVRRRADAALYRAKQTGRDRVVLSPDPPDHDRRDHDRRDRDRRDHDRARQAPT
jgi:two-component system cell cycle response regulator